MSIISSGSVIKATNQAVAYDNILDTGTVTVSSEATGYYKENAYDWRGDDILLFNSDTTHTITIDYGAAVSVDVFCLAYHNLGTLGATVTIRYSTDNFAADDNVLETLSPADDLVIFQPMTSIYKRYWRVQIALGAAGQPYVGQVLLGQMLNLPTPVPAGTPLMYDSDDDEIINNIAQDGNFLGMSIIYKGVKGTIKFEMMTTSYVRNSYRDFFDHARSKPFFYSWMPSLYDSEGIICWRSGNIPAPNPTSTKSFWSVPLQVEGRR